MKLPSFQFYPADWRKDPAVQALDYHDRGVWFEMLCLMHESEERGVLLLNGKPIPEDALARLLGLDKQNLTTTLTNLLTYGVAKKRKEDGAIYSKRMVKDEKLIQVRREAGKKGGNPALLNQKQTTQDKQKLTPSSSSSPSKNNNTPLTPLPDWLDEQTWEEWREHRKKIRKPMSDLAERKNINILAKAREEGHDPKEIIEQSIAFGWQGLFPDRRNNQGRRKKDEVVL